MAPTKHKMQGSLGLFKKIYIVMLYYTVSLKVSCSIHSGSIMLSKPRNLEYYGLVVVAALLSSLTHTTAVRAEKLRRS